MRKFECRTCHKSYRTKREQLIHNKRVHQGKFDFPCDICTKQFVDKLSLQRHVANMHSSFKKFNCHVCNKGFAIASHFNEHLTMVHGKEFKMTCEYCGKVLRDKRCLSIHIMSKHKREDCIHQCEFCTKKFSTQNLLRRHLKNVHHTHSSFIEQKSCYLLNPADEYTKLSLATSTKKKENVTETVEVKSGPQIIQSIDGINLESQDNLVEELLLAELEEKENSSVTTNDAKIEEVKSNQSSTDEIIGEGFKCYDCQKVYESQKSLRRHVKNKHLDISSKRKNDCVVCHTTFSHRYLLMLHMKKSHNLALEQKSKQNLSHNCEFCTKSYSRRECLRRHIREIHENPKNVDKASFFKCDICFKSYIYKEGLRRHIREIHENQNLKGGTCYICDNKHFQDLNRHFIMKHSKKSSDDIKESNCQPNMTRNICDMCDKRFKSLKSLLRHRQKVHLESTVKRKSSHLCSYCSKNFVSKYNLDIHIKTVHQQSRNFMCSQCGKCFGQFTSLHTHVSHVHAESSHRF